MYDEFKKIYERFELKFAFMKELFRDFEDFFNYTVSELSISTQSTWNTIYTEVFGRFVTFSTFLRAIIWFCFLASFANVK